MSRFGRGMVLALFGSAALATGLMPGKASAEQIRLSNNTFVQGAVVGAPTEEGLTFRLTRTGGQVFLRWSQIHDDDVRRLRKIEDPDDNLVLTVMIPGQRMELATGEELEGYITKSPEGYSLRTVRGKREFTNEDVLHFYADASINALAVMDPQAVLKHFLDTTPPETALAHYRAARLAERLALFPEAKAHLDECLAMSPTQVLASRATEFMTVVEELIRQEALMIVVGKARELARKDQYENALEVIDNVIRDHKPEGLILLRLQDVRKEIDVDFTKWVANRFFDELHAQALIGVKDKDVNGAMAYARGQLENDTLTAMAGKAGARSTPQDIRRRFLERYNLEREKKLVIRRRSASFTRDGWYTVVGGVRPVGGNRQTQGGTDGGTGRGVGPAGSGNSGGNFGGAGGNRLPFGGRDRDGVRDMIDDPAADGPMFQRAPAPAPGGGQQGGNRGQLPDRDTIEEYLKLLGEMQGGGNRGNDGGTATGPISRNDPNDSRMKVPANVPPIHEWWDKLGNSSRRNWVIALYVMSSGLVEVQEISYWDVKYR